MIMEILNHLQAIYNTLDTIQVTGIDNCAKLTGCANCVKSLMTTLQQEQDARKRKPQEPAPGAEVNAK